MMQSTPHHEKFDQHCIYLTLISAELVNLDSEIDESSNWKLKYAYESGLSPDCQMEAGLQRDQTVRQLRAYAACDTARLIQG